MKRNLGRLINLGELRLAMELSLELMKQGSSQVEMSEEGLMAYDIEDCLQVVVHALKKCRLPSEDILAWCKAMAKADRLKCIYDRELEQLRNHFRPSGS